MGGAGAPGSRKSESLEVSAQHGYLVPGRNDKVITVSIVPMLDSSIFYPDIKTKDGQNRKFAKNLARHEERQNVEERCVKVGIVKIEDRGHKSERNQPQPKVLSYHLLVYARARNLLYCM